MSEKLVSFRGIDPVPTDNIEHIEDKFVQALRNLIVEIVKDTLGTSAPGELVPRKKKRDAMTLRVVMPDGNTIEHSDATHTMELVVAKLGADLGFQRLANECPYLLSRDANDVSVSSVRHGEYHIFVGGSTHARLRKLQRAAQTLDEISGLKVEQVAKPG